MCVTAPGQIFAAGAEFNGHGGFGNQVPGPGPENVNPEDAIGFTVADNLIQKTVKENERCATTGIPGL
jgi:hypothetical protein